MFEIKLNKWLKPHDAFINQNTILIIQVLPMIKEQSQNKAERKRKHRKKKKNTERQT